MTGVILPRIAPHLLRCTDNLDNVFLYAQSLLFDTEIYYLMAKKKQTQNGKKIRSVPEYLTMLELAGRSPITIRNYEAVLISYAQFLTKHYEKEIPLEKVHEHLSTENLILYAKSRMDKSKNGRKVSLSILHRYMALNGVLFDELEHNVVKVAANEERTDKPLELVTLQKMMDLGNVHSRAILSFLISTGCRAGETSQILLTDIGRVEGDRFIPDVTREELEKGKKTVADITGDAVNIKNEYAKRGKGGTVFLTSEAREFLDLWLKERSAYIVKADAQTSRLLTASTHHQKVPRKDIGTPAKRPENDQRLFACSYSTIDKIFSRLYDAVDGEQGKYRARVTAHACRAYFRTNGAKTMGIDLVEGLLRHSGYLNQAYVRWTLEEKRNMFHAGEASLLITRADHRITSGKLQELEQQVSAQAALIQQLFAERVSDNVMQVKDKSGVLYRSENFEEEKYNRRKTA